jgi:peptidoglycan/xylan/chitin deacetylase (PgdA/CDA1 family)
MFLGMLQFRIRAIVGSLFVGFFFMSIGAGCFAQAGMPVGLNPFQPEVPFTPRTVSQVDTQFPALALTFDDGPHPIHTPRLLDILKQYGVRATFFVVGKNVERYPDIAQRIVSEGHQIGNHTMTHPNLVKLKRKRFDSEIKEVSTLIEAYTGVRPTAIRPPYGSLDPKVEAILRNLYGLNIILWSVDPQDWKKPGVVEVSRRLIEGARPGAILLAHDIHADTVEAMPSVLSQLKARGYRFGTIDQMLALPPTPPPPAGLASTPPTGLQSGEGAAAGLVSPPATVSGYRVPVLRALPAEVGVASP